jgi:hypothetical protein
MIDSIPHAEIACPLHSETGAILSICRILVIVDPAATSHPCVSPLLVTDD